jgi:hypothetical protein
LLSKRIASAQIGQWRKGGEGVTNAEEEVAMAQIPEVLGVVMQVPRGAGQGAAAGEFKQNGVDDAVLIVFGFVGQAWDEAVNDEREKKMLVVDVVQRQHRAAIEQELGG